MYENAKTVESSVCELQRDLAGQTQHVEGVVRIGAPDDFGNLFLAKHIGELQSLHPDLKIELITLPYTLSVSKREADISIGVERPAEGRLFVRRLTDFEMRLYATRGYIDAHGPIDQPSDLARQTWIGPVSDFNATTLLDAATELDCTPTLRFACSSFVGQLAAAINGAGVVMLPRYVADQERSLAPVLPDIMKTIRAYHMVVHADLRDLPRVRAVTNYIGQKAAEARTLFVPSPIGSNQSNPPSLAGWLAPEVLAAAASQERESASAPGRLTPAALAGAVALSAVNG
jgi:DNA-binding transcriptional LysR family regulator